MICKLEIQSSPSQVNISIAVLQAPAFLVFDGKEIKMGDLQGKYHMTGCHNQSLLLLDINSMVNLVGFN